MRFWTMKSTLIFSRGRRRSKTSCKTPCSNSSRLPKREKSTMRVTTPTKMEEKSSRAHTVLYLAIRSKVTWIKYRRVILTASRKTRRKLCPRSNMRMFPKLKGLSTLAPRAQAKNTLILMTTLRYSDNRKSSYSTGLCKLTFKRSFLLRRLLQTDLNWIPRSLQRSRVSRTLRRLSRCLFTRLV